MALDSENSELSGIALDHYQYYHYKEILTEQFYIAKIHSSNPIAVGFLFGVGNEGNHTIISHVANPLSECFTRHALLNKLILDEQIIESLNHTNEVSKFAISSSTTVNTFFGADVILPLIASGAILIVVLVTYGLLDYFILLKRCREKRPLHEEGNKDNDLTIKHVKLRVEQQKDETIDLHDKSLQFFEQNNKK